MALAPSSTWPSEVSTLSQNSFGSGWDMGAYVYPYNGNNSLTSSITSPAGGSSLQGRVSLAASATTTDGTVASVQFKLDGSNLGSSLGTYPYATSWDTISAGSGSHTLTALATDNFGNATTSAPVTVAVSIPTFSGGSAPGLAQPYIPGVGLIANSTAPSTPRNTESPSVSSTPSYADLQKQLQSLMATLCGLADQARARGISLSPGVSSLCPAAQTPSRYAFTRNLALWDTGEDVRELQDYLISRDAGPAARALGNHGSTLIFGHLTLAALIEYQASAGLPATGFFGPMTRAALTKHP